MANWKYTDASNRVVMRTFEDGSSESCLVEALPEGAVIDPADPQPVVIPQSVTMRQARLALLNAGLLAGVNNAINVMPSPQKEAAQIEWEYSQEVHRNKTLVAMLAPALGLSDAQLDALFIAAAAL